MRFMAVFFFAFFSIAHAQEYPLIVKFNHSGYTSEEYIRTEKCEVFFDRVIITKRFGLHVPLIQTIPISLGQEVTDLINSAQGEELSSTENGICDLPTTSISAENHLSILLFDTGGCGAPRLVRQGGSSQALMDIILGFCPKINDI